MILICNGSHRTTSISPATAARTFHHRFLNQPEEQLGGVRKTIGNYLQYFLTPEVAEVFYTKENTFNYSVIDEGKIIFVTRRNENGCNLVHKTLDRRATALRFRD